MSETAEDTVYRDPAEINPAALRVLAGKCLEEHPDWDDEEIIKRLTIAYPGYDPDKLTGPNGVLRGALAAAKSGWLTAARELEALRNTWGEHYDLEWAAGGQYIAVSRDDGRRTFTAGSPRELAAALRDDYSGQKA